MPYPFIRPHMGPIRYDSKIVHKIKCYYLDWPAGARRKTRNGSTGSIIWQTIILSMATRSLAELLFDLMHKHIFYFLKKPI